MPKSDRTATLAEISLAADTLIREGTFSDSSSASPLEIVGALVRSVFDFIDPSEYVPTLFL
jgi:hypothetical protein